MLRIYLTRHGETVWNRENRTQGWTDIALNASGRQHAGALSRALRDVPLDAVYASTLMRAIATAEAIAAPHRLPVATDPDLRELHQGTLDGLTGEELRREHADFLRLWRAGAAALQMPGGESMAELQERAWSAIERIVAQHPVGAVAVVSHNLTIVTILCRIFGLHLDDFRRLRQDVAAINILEFGPAGPAAIRVNDAGHITAGQRVARDLAAIADSPRFADVGMPNELVERIIAAAGGAGLPDGAWQMLVVDAPRRQQLESAVRNAARHLTEGEASTVGTLESAPILIAVLRRGDGTVSECRIGAAIQSVRIAADAFGYGSAWLPDALCVAPAVAAALELTPEWQLAALLPIGMAE